MKKYKAVFFDLDHTLWDFELNSLETLKELYEIYLLESKGVSDINFFIETYRRINFQLWDDYDKNLINKEQLRSNRFLQTLKKFNINDQVLAEKLAVDYLRICPDKKNVFPGTAELLEELDKKYSLHIITNGFAEVQHRKLKNSGIIHYFDKIHISEHIGYKKPQPEIFHYAVMEAEAVHEQCIMIGDNLETDITGAINAGIDHVLFNPGELCQDKRVRKQVKKLTDLLEWL